VFSFGINQRRLEGKDLRQSPGGADRHSGLFHHVPRIGRNHCPRRRQALQRLPDDEVQHSPSHGQTAQQDPASESLTLTSDLGPSPARHNLFNAQHTNLMAFYRFRLCISENLSLHCSVVVPRISISIPDTVRAFHAVRFVW